VPVLINPSGYMGTMTSSRRFKEDIRDMAEASEGLRHLRPVTFRYTAEHAPGERPRQYGLIAEEVAEVYPDLVVYTPTGEVETVQYHQLPVMLLNEFQQQQRTIEAQREELGKQREEVEALKAANADLMARLAALEHRLR